METCDICHKQLSNKSKLKRHKDTVHQAVEKVTCDICGILVNSESLIVHKNRIHLKVKWQCELCEKTLSKYNKFQVGVYIFSSDH